LKHFMFYMVPHLRLFSDYSVGNEQLLFVCAIEDT